MVKILIDLNESEDRKVSLYKVDRTFETKEEAIREMIRRYPLKPFTVTNVFPCVKCGEPTDEVEAENFFLN